MGKRTKSFNPLEIGSSVLMCLELHFSNSGNKFQSPRNWVKCSDKATRKLSFIAEASFNPLEIGSSVLIPPF